MDTQLLIILIGLAVIALGIGFLLGWWLINRRVGLKLKLASQDYNRSKDELNQSNSALMQSRKELDLFKKTSIPEFEKLKAALELTKNELAQAQTDLAKARAVASTASAQSNEISRAGSRKTDEKQSATLAGELPPAHDKNLDESGSAGQIDTVEVADDFFSVDSKADKNDALGFFSKPEFSQASNGKLHEQEALINQYMEEVQKQQSKIDELLAENDALQQSVAQATDDSLAQSPTGSQSDFDGFVVNDDEDNAAEINNLTVELQLATQRVKELSAEVETLTAEKAKLEETPHLATQGDTQSAANLQSEASEQEELKQALKQATDQKKQLSADVAKRIAERDELTAKVEQAALREEKLSSEVESLTARAADLGNELDDSKERIKRITDAMDGAVAEIDAKDKQLIDAGKSTETLRKAKDNAELSAEVLRDENASLKKAANTYKEQFKTLQASVPSEAELQKIELNKESQQKEILSLTRKLHHADRINNDLQQRSLEIPKLESRLQKLDEMNVLTEQQASQIASLSQAETRLKDQNDELRLINSEYLNMEHKNENLSRENTKLRTEVDRIPSIIKESQDARSQVNELTGLVETAHNTEIDLNKKIEAARRNEDELNARIENAEKNAVKLDSQVESARQTEAELREELEKAQRSLTKLDDYDSVTQRLESLQLENRKLIVEVNNFDELSANYKMMRDRNDELMDQINQFDSQSVKLGNVKSEPVEHNTSRQVKDDAQLELDIGLVNEQPVKASAKKAGVKKKTAAKPVSKKSPAVAKQTKKASVTKLPVNRKATGKRKLQEKDDLKEIHGIGPKLEKLLNDHGISTFEQLAQLSKSETDDLAIKIGRFGERITRDKWVSKAKRLAKSKKKAA